MSDDATGFPLRSLVARCIDAAARENRGSDLRRAVDRLETAVCFAEDRHLLEGLVQGTRRYSGKGRSEAFDEVMSSSGVKAPSVWDRSGMSMDNLEQVLEEVFLAWHDSIPELHRGDQRRAFEAWRQFSHVRDRVPPWPVWIVDYLHAGAELRQQARDGLAAVRRAVARQFGISSRSVLVEDHRRTGQGLETFLNYRTVITLPPGTEWVDLSARADLPVTIAGRQVTLDAAHVERFTPNALSRLVVNIDAHSVSVPPIMLRAEFMDVAEVFLIFPDIDAHKKLSAMPAGALHEHREALGVPARFTADDLAHAQNAIANMAAMVQHTYNDTGAGVCHDRACTPGNMSHPHWMLDFRTGRPVYEPLHEDQVQLLNGRSQPYRAPLAQSLGSWLKGAVSDATHIVVHTVEFAGNAGGIVLDTGIHLGGDIVATAGHVARDTIQTTAHLGEHLVQGNLRGMVTDVGTGIGSLAGDLIQGGENLGGDVLKGTQQLAVVTIHFADDVVHFALAHTGIIGEIIGHFVEKVGILLHKLVDWLKSVLGWTDILNTQRQLNRAFHDTLAQLPATIHGLRPKVDRFFDEMRSSVDTNVDAAIARLGGQRPGRASVDDHPHSEAIEKIEWLLSKILEGGSAAGQPALAAAGGSRAGVAGSAADLVAMELRSLTGDMELLLERPSEAPETLLRMLLELLKRAIDAIIELCRGAVDALMDGVEELVRRFESMVNAPIDVPFVSDLFAYLADGEKLTILNLATLIIAIPATLICKLVHGRAPSLEGSVALGSVSDWHIVCGTAMMADGLLSGCLDLASPPLPPVEREIAMEKAYGFDRITEIDRVKPEGFPGRVRRTLDGNPLKVLEYASVVVSGFGIVAGYVNTRKEYGTRDDAEAVAAYAAVVSECIPLFADVACLGGGGATLQRFMPEGPPRNLVFHVPMIVFVVVPKAVSMARHASAESAMDFVSDCLGAARPVWQLSLGIPNNPAAKVFAGACDVSVATATTAYYFLKHAGST